jgi:PAS domain S-box-containing protein
LADADASLNKADFLTGGGDMAALMRAHDWSASPLGRPDTWPQSLRSVVGLLLSSKFPMFVAWGPELGFLYNEPYAQILGAKHPSALGARFRDIWSEIWADISPLVDAALAGQATYHENLPLVMNRRGYDEQTWFSFSYSPVREENGQIAGMYCACTETTGQVLAERRLAAETERQRRLFEQAPGFIAILDGPQHVFEFANAAYRRLFGDREYIGKPAREAFPDVEGQGFFELLDKVYATGERFAAERTPIRFERPGASLEERFLDFIYEPVIHETGQVTGIFVEGYDVTDTHRAELALRESEARLGFLDRLGAATAPLADADAVLATTTRLLGEQLDLSVCAYADMDEDQDGFTIRGDWAAPGSTSIVGHYSLADFGKLAVKNLSGGLPLVVNDNLRELAPEEAATFQNIGIAATICMPLVKEGRLTALMAIHDRVPRIWTEAELGLLGEVTARSWAHVERVAAVGALRESEGRFRLMADTVPQIVWITDGEGRVEFFNRQWFDYVGVAQTPATAGQVAASHVHPDDAAATVAAFEEARRNGSTYLVEHRIRSAEGEYRWFLVRGDPYRDPKSGEVVRWFGASVDIHDRKLAEEALRESEARLARALDAGELGAWELDLETLTAWRSPQHDRIFGYGTPLAAWTYDMFLEHVVAEDRNAVDAKFREALAGGGRWEFECRIRRADGELRWIWAQGKVDAGGVGQPARIKGMVRDITRRRDTEEALRELNETLESRVAERTAELGQAQEALRQSQKLEAMGQLTGGVAHDFNNLLTPIIGSLDMLMRRGVGSERERRLIDGALQSAERAKTLVQRLLAFARRQPLQPTAVDVKQLVGGMAELIASTSGPKVDVRVELPDDLPPAIADANQLEMAVLNLAVNARDAMPDGGVLKISAVRESVRTDRGSKLRHGHYVRLSVADTGTGMDEATLSRAIEPFFSTKGIGKGTGLGLSMVHGLALQLNGDLTITSRPGEGTSVDLWLPISTVLPDSNDQVASGAIVPRALGKALLVDDEDLVRMSTADMLADLGYEVVEASSAEEALQLVGDGLAPDLLVTDHLMPGLTGAELAHQLRSTRPGLPVLIVSGYAEAEGMDPSLARLTKPFRNAELAASLSALLPDAEGSIGLKSTGDPA